MRFTSNDFTKAGFPTAIEFPNTGHGFTAGNSTILGIPELQVVNGGMNFKTAAIIRKTADGREVFEAVLDIETGLFKKIY